MKRTRFIAAGIIISLLMFSSAVYAANNTDTVNRNSARIVTAVAINGRAPEADQVSVLTGTKAAATPEIPVPQETAPLVTDQNVPGAGWILILMIVFPLAIGFALGWFVNSKIQAKKAEAYAAEDIEDQEEVTQYTEIEQPVHATRQREDKVKIEPQPLQPKQEAVYYAPPPVVPIIPVAPPAPVIPDPIPGQIDDWGNPYFYDDQGIPYYYDPRTAARMYYETEESQT